MTIVQDIIKNTAVQLLGFEIKLESKDAVRFLSFLNSAHKKLYNEVIKIHPAFFSKTVELEGFILSSNIPILEIERVFTKNGSIVGKNFSSVFGKTATMENVFLYDRYGGEFIPSKYLPQGSLFVEYLTEAEPLTLETEDEDFPYHKSFSYVLEKRIAVDYFQVEEVGQRYNQYSFSVREWQSALNEYQTFLRNENAKTLDDFSIYQRV